MKKTQIIFLAAKDNQTKLSNIVNTVAKHYANKEKILIHVANEAVAKYVDDLLWKQPPDTLLPHKVATSPAKEYIIITHTLHNLNNAEIVINLTTDLYPNFQQFSIVYDLFDETSQEKQQYSQLKQKKYQELIEIAT